MSQQHAAPLAGAEIDAVSGGIGMIDVLDYVRRVTEYLVDTVLS